MKREDARKDINGRPLTDFVTLQRSRKAGRDMYICPVCGSGTGKNGTGAFHIYPDSNRVFCYAGGCFTDKGEDTLGALKIIWNCSETEVFEKLGYSLGDIEAPKNTEHKEYKENKKHQENQETEKVDYTAFYKKCHEALKKDKEALEYLHGRHITDELIDRFNLGYCSNWKHSKAGKLVSATKRIIIPRTEKTYLARRIDKAQNEIEEKYEKQVEGRGKDLFNLEALEGAESVIICEGEFDALTLYRAGANAVIGLGSTTNINVMFEEAKKHPDIIYILALDNDKKKEDGKESGKEAQLKLAEMMKEAGIIVLNMDPATIYDSCKDANEAFSSAPDRLCKMVDYLQSTAREIKTEKEEEKAAEIKNRTGEGMLDNFFLTVTNSENRTFEPIPTGIKDIDRALEGGFIRGTLVTLGAPPAMGKTALAQWIFENIAASGQDVLYINLEMSREQLLARSISRLAWKYEKKDYSTLDILRGYKWTEEQREIITKAANIYKRDIAAHFIYNPDGVTNGIESILKAMESETARIKAQGRPEPIICIDYLQLIDSGERDAVEGMKSVIFKLKDFAKRNNTVLFVIIANNRASNKSGTVEMESGRDTSAIEYSGDLMLGLAYTAIEDKRTYEAGSDKKGDPIYKEYDLEKIRQLKKEAYEKNQEIPPVCNEISLKVLKSRFTESERRAKLIFDGKHSTFNQVELTYTSESAGGQWNDYNWENPFII